MVKDSKTGSLPRPKRDKSKPTRARAPVLEEIRSDRLMMRMHTDLVKLLDARAHEAGESRSRYIEKLLVAFLRIDPRNPKMDAWGRIDPKAPAPIRWPNDQLSFGEKWARWKDLNERLLGFRVPDEWLDDEIGNWMWEQKQPPDDTPEPVEEWTIDKKR